MRKTLDAVKHRGIMSLSETEKDLIQIQLMTSEIQRVFQLAGDGAAGFARGLHVWER